MGQEDKGGSGRVQEDPGGFGKVGRVEEALVGLFESGRV